jgi:hypothetical protein
MWLAADAMYGISGASMVHLWSICLHVGDCAESGTQSQSQQAAVLSGWAVQGLCMLAYRASRFCRLVSAVVCQSR